MNRLKKLKITYYFIIIAVICLGFYFLQKIGNDSSPNDVLSILGQDIYFTYTDDNTGEDLIIKSDKKDYEGFNQSIVYFNLTNTKRRTELIDLQVLFNNGSGSVTNIDKWDKQRRDWVSLDEERFVLADDVIAGSETTKQSRGIRGFFARLLRQGQSLLARLKGIVPVSIVSDSLTLKTRTQYLIESKETAYFRMAINYPPMSQGEFFIQAQGNKGGYGLLDPWYSSSWSYRKKVTIDKDKIMTDATDFPVLATTTDADLASHARSDAYDIVFTDAAGTALNYEREKWTSGTGELAAWIQTDVSSTTDTVLYMYYGNASQATDLATTTGVWDDDYKGVWHLAHDGVATTTYPDFLDSTQNDNDGSSKNMVGDISNLISTSTIDGGVGFDGDNDTVVVNDHSSLTTGSEITLSAWIYPTTLDVIEGVINKWNTEPDGEYNLWIFSNDIDFYIADGSDSKRLTSTSDVITTDNWHHIVATYNGDTGDIVVYHNGGSIKSDTTTITTMTDLDDNVAVGSYKDSDHYFDGIIDEVRVAMTARSAQWIATEYNNQSDAASFITFGAEQTDDWYNSDWLYRKKITVDKDYVMTNAADFPILATTTDDNLSMYARNDGYDILFTADDGLTKINYEREKFDSATGELVSWIKTDVSSTTDTILYMYYGNLGQTTDQATTTGVWDDNYVMVQHMHHDWDASAVDSTKYDNDGTNTNFYSATSSVSTSQIDGGIDFDGSDDYVEIDHNAVFNFDSDGFSISLWVKQYGTGGAIPTLIDKRPEWNEGFVLRGVNSLGLRYGNGVSYNDVYTSGLDMSDALWHHVIFTIDSSGNCFFYVDGVESTDGTETDDLDVTTSANIRIGQSYDNLTNGFNGTIDEVRISDTARSAQWIETEYNTQSAVGEFLSFDSQTAYSGGVVSWYNNNWLYRKAITIEADQITANQDNFPVLATTTDSDLKFTSHGGDVASSTISDIVFTAYDGKTVLNWEREKYASSTGELVAWIDAQSISSTTDATIYMYYGNSSLSSDTATTTGVWNDNYKMVQHMDHDWDATAEDSTKYDNDGTNTNFYSATSSVSTSQIDGGIDFDGSDDYILFDGIIELPKDSTWAISWWCDKEATGDDVIFGETTENTRNGIWMRGGSNSILWMGDDYTIVSFLSIDDETVQMGLHYWTITRNGADFILYRDGVNIKTASDASEMNWEGAADSQIGAMGSDHGNAFNGTLDEVRISNTVRSAQWIETEYNNQSAVGEFTTFGEEEGAPSIASVSQAPDPVNPGSTITFSIDWTGYSGQTIKAKICKTDSLTNQNCDGGSWATSTTFTSDDPETVTYAAQEADKVHQDYYAFVCDVDALCSSSSQGAFQVGSATQINAPLTNFMTSGLVGHWTFNGPDMDWSSSTAEALDRSGNSNNGNVTGFDHTSVARGISGQALEFDGTDDYVEIADSQLWDDIDTNGSISVWFKTAIIPGASKYPVIIARRDGGTWIWHMVLDGDSSGELSFNDNGGDTDFSGNPPLVNQWQHAVLTWESNNARIYQDGILTGTDTSTAGIGTGSIGLGIGSIIGSHASRTHTGTIDEVRVYNRALSADEITDLYRAGARRLQTNASLGDKDTGGLVGSWTFNGQDMDWSSSTAEALDRSGNSNNGNVTNFDQTSVARGISGQALEFDGVDDYVDVADANSLDATNVTLSAWVKSDTTGRYIIAKDPPGGETSKAVQPQYSNLEELKIKEVEPEKYAFKTLDGGLIEIGTERHSPPQPYVKINKWDGEVSMKVDIPYVQDGEKSLENNKVKWTGENYDVQFYPKEPEIIEENGRSFSINQEGGVEFDLILKEKSSTNVFEFPIETNGLEFFYQPPLHPDHPTWSDEDGDGTADNFRPENVVGSYAIYHESKQGDYSKVGGKNYMAGKAFHIYRPKITDNAGNWIWGELKIDEQEGVLRVIIDQGWLNKAVYPVNIDPNFGYETAGTTGVGSVNANVMIGVLFTSPADVDTATSITVYGNEIYNDVFIKAAIVLHGSLDIIANGITDAVDIGAGEQEYTLTFSTPPSLSASTEYLLAVVSNINSFEWNYDTGDADQMHYDDPNSYASPESMTGAGHDNRKYTIYCTYASVKDVPYALRTTGGGSFMFMSSANIYAATSTTDINDSNWHHITGTYDGSAIRLYTDGVLEDTNSDPSGNLPTNAGNVRIGADYETTPGNFFDGTIDEVRIYNRALSADEILDLYQAGARRSKLE